MGNMGKLPAAGAAGRLRLARVDAGRSGGFGHQARLRREGYGNIFPGHGGVLDRFDSILPLGTAAAALLAVNAL